MNLIKYFEKAAFIFCAVIIALFVVSEAVDVIYSIYTSLVTTTSFHELLIHDTETDQVIKTIFNIFIGLELLQTIKMYFEEKLIRGEMILLIALTAISRKLIIMDYAHTAGMENIGLGILIAALGLGYYFIKKTNSKREL